MNKPPADILLARAISHLDRAMLELQAGDIDSGAQWVIKGIDLLREVLER